MNQKDCPFSIGKKYRVRRSHSYLNHEFHEGEIVLFSSNAYSPKEGVTRFWFKTEGSNDINVWHVYDDEQEKLASWEEMFEELETA